MAVGTSPCNSKKAPGLERVGRTPLSASHPVARVTQCQRWPARPSRVKRLGRLLTDPKGSAVLEGELRSTTSGSPLSTALVVSARLVVSGTGVASSESVTLFDP